MPIFLCNNIYNLIAKVTMTEIEGFSQKTYEGSVGCVGLWKERREGTVSVEEVMKG